MTQLGTPTAETWNKQAISATCWGHATAAPQQARKPAKISRTKLDRKHPGYKPPDSFLPRLRTQK